VGKIKNKNKKQKKKNKNKKKNAKFMTINKICIKLKPSTVSIEKSLDRQFEETDSQNKRTSDII